MLKNTIPLAAAIFLLAAWYGGYREGWEQSTRAVASKYECTPRDSTVAAPAPSSVSL